MTYKVIFNSSNNYSVKSSAPIKPKVTVGYTFPIQDIERRVDTNTVGVIFVGQALAISSESTSVWTIVRTIYNNAGVRVSRGTATDVAWTDRETATYT